MEEVLKSFILKCHEIEINDISLQHRDNYVLSYFHMQRMLKTQTIIELIRRFGKMTLRRRSVSQQLFF